MVRRLLGNAEIISLSRFPNLTNNAYTFHCTPELIYHVINKKMKYEYITVLTKHHGISKRGGFQFSFPSFSLFQFI